MDNTIEVTDHLMPLRTQEEEGNYPALEPSVPPKEYSEEYAKEKSIKYNFALGDVSPGVNHLYSSILADGPDAIAETVAATKEVEDERARVNMLMDVANATKGKPLDRPTHDFITSLSHQELQDLKSTKNDQDFKAKANELYARKVADKSIASTDYAFKKFFEKDYSAEEYHAPRDVAEGLMSWNEDVNDTINELQARFSGQSFLGKGYDYFEQWIVPGASYFNKRNTVESPGQNPNLGPKGGSIFLGSNLEAQYQYLWSLPLEKRREVFKKAVETIAEDNLLDAMEFAQGALDYSRSQAVLDNAFSVMELTTVGDAISIAKAGKSAAKKGAKKGASDVGKVIAGEGEDLNQGIADNIVQAVRNSKAGIAPSVAKKEAMNEYEKSLHPTDIWGHISGSGPKLQSKDSKMLQHAQAGFNNGRIKSEADVEKFLKTYNDTGSGIERTAAKMGVSRSVDKVVENVKKAVNTKNDLPFSFAEEPASVVNRMRQAVDGDIPAEQFGKNAARDVVEAADPTNPNLEADLSVAAGHEVEGAGLKAEKLGMIEQLGGPPNNTRGRVELESFVPSMFSQQAAKTGRQKITKISNRLAQRIAETLNKISGKLDQALQDSRSIVSRIGNDPNALNRAMQIAQEDFKKHFPETDNAILDVQMVAPEDNLGNAIEVYTTIGRPDQTLFERPEHAFNMATTVYNFRKKAFDVVQIGNKFAIRMKTTVNEGKLRDFLIPADGDNTTPVGIFNTLLGKIRTTDDLVSAQANRNRHAVTHAYAGLQNAVKEAAEAINKVKRIPGGFKRLERVLKAGLHETTPVQVRRRNPATGVMETVLEDKPGKEWDAAGFQKKYLELNGQLPSDDEVVAYEVYKKLNDFDEAIRNLDLYSETASMGYREWSVKAVQLQDDGTRGLSWSKGFHGRLEDDLPYDSVDDSIVAIKTEGSDFTHIFDVKNMTDGQKEMVKNLKEAGYKIIKIMNPDQRPLREVFDSEEAVNFVLVKESQSSPLKYKMLPTQFGGHRIVNEGWFVKAPRISKPTRRLKDAAGNIIEQDLGKHSYDGEVTLFGVHSEKKAKEIIPYLEKARQAFLKGDRAAFIDVVSRHLPKDPERVWKDFEEGTIPSEHPFFVTKSGQGVNDTEGFRKYARGLKNFTDVVDSQHNDQRKINKKFAGEKSPDVFSYGKEGSEHQPVFKFKTARYVDPYTAMTTSMSSLMKNRAYKDYIQHSVNSWVEEFGDLLNVDITKLRNNPLHYLHNPEWVDKPSDAGRLAAAKNSRLAVINTLGTRTEMRTNIDWMKGKIVDFVYKNVGDKASLYVHDILLPTASDPMSFIRGAAFHMKIGLFNPTQIWTQSQTLFHMAAITGNPIRSGQAMIGSTYMTLLRFTEDPVIIRRVAGMAKNSGWGDAEEFIESYEALKKTGLFNIEGEHAWQDDVLDAKMYESFGKKILDKGTIFFKETERYVRLASWNTAFKEWKKANPGKKLVRREDINKVLARQNLLSLNMTSASAAAFQKGIFSIPTQFWGYQMRMLDQMLGKRLTAAEKIRVFATYNMLYGVPVGGVMGLATPWYDDIIASAEENGYNTNEGAAQLFFKGALSFLAEGMFGEDYNTGKRYGPGGIALLKTILDPESNEDQLMSITGASSSIFADAARWSYPALSSLWSQVMDKDGEQIPLDPQDFIDAFRSISTVNNAVKAYFALEYSSYYSRDGQKVATVDEMDAVAISLFGLVPDRIEKMYRQMNYLKEDKEAIRLMEKEYTKNMKNALRAKTPEDREIYLKRAQIIARSARLTTKEANQWFKHSLSGDEELILQMDEEFRKRQEQRNAQ